MRGTRRTTAAKRRTASPSKPRLTRARGEVDVVDVALASLAHDIRTPLTGILALAELLVTSDLPERERRWAETIKSTADHLSRFTALVVDAARADATGLVLREDAFSPRELVRSIAEALRARAAVKGLKVKVAGVSKIPAGAVGDEVRLRGALENLIDNAVKFTERGSVSLSVSAGRPVRGRIPLSFAIADSGIGMSIAERRKLFRPFSQVSEQVGRRFGGSGLGLAVVKRVAKALGGGLTVTSRPGEGSTFTLTVKVAARPAARGLAKDAALRRQPLRILCVEDNPFSRVVLNTMLHELGHATTFVGDGERALAIVSKGGHDLVLMDVALSGMDGIETTRCIRSLPPPHGRIPIVGLSARTGANDAVAAAAAGMNVYLRKPVGPAALNEALTRLAPSRDESRSSRDGIQTVSI